MDPRKIYRFMFLIREEESSDSAAIRKVNETAFNGLVEAKLIELLREAKKVICSLVATVNEQIVGHILFSSVAVEFNPHNVKGLGLAPIAVIPSYQNQGIGSDLIIQGLEICRKKEYGFVVVLGDESFYADFGFNRASQFGFGNEYGLDEGFMVLELYEDAIKTVHGLVKYHPEFNLAES